MGWFDSDYEAEGSTSLSQLGQQRYHGDTYIGDLILSNIHTGKNIAQNVRDELFIGTTAFMRRYHKEGKRRGFTATLEFPSTKDPSEYLALMSSVGVDVVFLNYYDYGAIEDKRRYLGANTSYSYGPGVPQWDGVDIATESTYVVYNSTLVNGNFYYDAIRFTLITGVVIDTGIRAVGSSDSPIPKGFFAKYESSNGRYYYFYSQDSIFASDAGDIENIDVMPVVSLKDNLNTEATETYLGFTLLEVPYYKNPSTSQLLIDRNRVLDKLGADFEELSKGIFEPDPIPDVGTLDWKRDYGNTWDDSIKACAKNQATEEQQKICAFVTEQAWHDDMVENGAKQNDSIRNITDAYFGFFVSMKTLDMVNAAALFLTLQPLMNRLYRTATKKQTFIYTDFGGAPDKSYSFKIKAGTLDVEYSMSDYTYIRRRGTVIYPWESTPRLRKKKCSFNIAKTTDLVETDPIIEVLKDKSPADAGSDNTDDWGGAATWDPDGDLCLELRMQDLPDINGNPTYLEMRLYGLWAEHAIDVLRDGTEGQAASAVVRGGLSLDMEDPAYADVIVFPISTYAVDEIPIFLRERLAREATCLVIDGISVTEVKWYQQGWFAIVMFIVAVIITVWTGGAGFGLVQVLTAAAKVAVITIIAKIILDVIDNPILAAIAMVVLAVLTGNYSPSSFVDMGMLAVEATGTYLQKKMAQEMIKLQEEAAMFAEERSEAIKEMRELEEQTGLNHYDRSDLIVWLTTLPPIEFAEDSLDRSLKTDHNEIDVSAKLDIGNKLNL